MAGNDFERHKYNYTIPQDTLRQLKKTRQLLAEKEYEITILKAMIADLTGELDALNRSSGPLT